MHMPSSQHQDLARGRWRTLSLAGQLGNVGSEFERAIRWKEKNQTLLSDKAVARMLELLDLTIADTRWHNHRLYELTRLREEVCRELSTNSMQAGSIHALQKYFLSFATWARQENRQVI